jgi:ACS family pantothenate transporter-like MFS transporter
MAPTFRRGFPATWGFVWAGLVIIYGIKLLADRDERRAALAKRDEVVVEGPASGSRNDVDSEEKYDLKDEANVVVSEVKR